MKIFQVLYSYIGIKILNLFKLKGLKNVLRGVFLKKGVILFGVGFIIAVSSLFIIRNEIAGANTIPSVIRSSEVIAAVPKGAVLYDNIEGKAVNLILSGQKVEILKDRGGEWYYVKYKEQKGWVKAVTLDIPRTGVQIHLFFQTVLYWIMPTESLKVRQTILYGSI